MKSAALAWWILFLSSAVFPPAAFSAGEVAPIVISPTATTNRDFQKLQIAWAERVWVTPFQKRSAGEPWAADALGFLSRTIPDWALMSSSDGDSALAAEAKELLATGCTDPLILYFAGRAINRGSDDWRTARAQFQTATKALVRDKSYPAALRLFAASGYISVQAEHWRESVDVHSIVLQAITEALSDNSYLPTETEILVRHLVARIHSQTLKVSAKPLLKLYSESRLPEWARQTLIGSTEVDLAWKERSGDVASKVTVEGWEGFAEHLGKAEEALVAAWKLRPDRPEAAAEMVSVSLGSGRDDETIRAWFDRAVAAQFDYAIAYDRYMVSLRPRWGGSLQAVFGFGQACAETGRFDTDVPLELFKACRLNSEDVGDDRSYYREPEVRRTLIKACRALLTEPTRAHEKATSLASLAVNAWLAGDYALAHETLLSTPTPFTSGMKHRVKRAGVLEPEFRHEVAILASPAGKDFERGVKAADQRAWPAARTSFKKAMGSAPAANKAYLEHRLRLLDISEKLESGEWVKMPLDLSTFRPWLGDWTLQDDGSLQIAGKKQDGLLLLSLDPGRDYECRGEFEYEMKTPAELQIQVVLGLHRKGFLERWAGAQTFAAVGEKPVASLVNVIYGAGEESVPIAFPEKNQFQIKVEDGAVTWTLNGRELMNNRTPLMFKLKQGPIGLSAISIAPGTTVKLRSFELRKIKLAE
ncbi:MAG TPA: hypothetical protein VGO90_04030 [Chthoniobacteraceae bacterium]|nr:hypothetical protein [Chthoniobacteraceae bacterium]